MNRSPLPSIHNVPFISETQIARKTDQLICEYFDKKGRKPCPPIPAELILQRTLGYSISYGELEEEIAPGVLGALLEEEKEVRLDASLCEEGREGRHNFTLGHEVGHLALHVELLKQTDFLMAPGTPSIVCRSHSYSPVEVQADKFAACLLMPEHMVRDVWAREISAP